MTDRPEFHEIPEEDFLDPTGEGDLEEFSPWSSPQAQAEALADVRASERRQDSGREETPL